MKSGLKILAMILSLVSCGITLAAGIVNDKLLDQKIDNIVDKKMH